MRERYQGLERAAKKVSRELPGRLRVAVTYAGNVGGRLSETFGILTKKADVSVASLADACRQGSNALVKEFGLPETQASHFVNAAPGFPC